MWRVLCGERRRGRDKCLETDNWVVLLIFDEANMEVTPRSPRMYLYVCRIVTMYRIRSTEVVLAVRPY